MDKIKIAILPNTEYLNKDNEAYEISKISMAFGEKEAERLRDLGNKRARVASLCGLLALLSLLKEKSGRIVRNANGKPYFEDSTLPQFSISHSGGVSVAACSDFSVGIDIELISTDRDHKRIADRFFTKAELDTFYNNGSDTKSFFEIWTRKEAYVKYLGESLAPLLSKDATGCVFKSFLVEYDKSEYIITLCTHKEAEVEISVLSDDVNVKAN
jgi:4'-phosphopantetheinyl transferase